MNILKFDQEKKVNKKQNISDTQTIPLNISPQKQKALQRKLAKEATTNRENLAFAAQELIYDAWDSDSKTERKRLAKKALTIFEDCADAYGILAQYEQSPDKELQLLQKAVTAGERALGAKAFKEMSGHFWGFLETRPYMRALESLAFYYEEAEDWESAVDIYNKMLVLNPNDNQGVRHSLLSILIILGRDDDAELLFKKYEEDVFACWAYSRLLLDYRKYGENDRRTIKSMKTALEINIHAAYFITEQKILPYSSGEYTLGSEDEAVEYLLGPGGVAWDANPKAIYWLTRQMVS